MFACVRGCARISANRSMQRLLQRQQQQHGDGGGDGEGIVMAMVVAAADSDDYDSLILFPAAR